MAELADAHDSKSCGAIHESSILSPGTRIEGRRQLGCRGGVARFCSSKILVTDSLPAGTEVAFFWQSATIAFRLQS